MILIGFMMAGLTKGHRIDGAAAPNQLLSHSMLSSRPFKAACCTLIDEFQAISALPEL